METRFGIGSMNEMFTAVAVLQLSEAGKLALEDTLARWLPDYPNVELARSVTLHHLLTHTGGTGDIFGPDYDAHQAELLAPRDYVTLFGKRGLEFQPGERFSYSNYGFVLLGRAIEKASGRRRQSPGRCLPGSRPARAARRRAAERTSFWGGPATRPQAKASSSRRDGATAAPFAPRAPDPLALRVVAKVGQQQAPYTAAVQAPIAVRAWPQTYALDFETQRTDGKAGVAFILSAPRGDGENQACFDDVSLVGGG